MIDHFSTDAIRKYLLPFDRAFAGHDLGGLRAFFNDSYEVDDATGEADWTPRVLRRVPKAARLRPATPSARALRREARRCQRSRARGLSRNDLGPAPRHVHHGVVRVGETPGAPRPQPGARITGEPPRPLCGERHTRNGGRRDSAVQVGDVRGPRRRTPAGLCRGGDVARRALPRDARRGAGRGRSVLHRRRQPHRLSRHRVFARRRALARLAVLRQRRVQPAECLVGRLRRAQRVRRACPVLPAVRAAGHRRAAVLPVLRVADGSREVAAWRISAARRHHRRARPSRRRPRRFRRPASPTTSSPTVSCAAHASRMAASPRTAARRTGPSC